MKSYRLIRKAFAAVLLAAVLAGSAAGPGVGTNALSFADVEPASAGTPGSSTEPASPSSPSSPSSPASTAPSTDRSVEPTSSSPAVPGPASAPAAPDSPSVTAVSVDTSVEIVSGPANYVTADQSDMVDVGIAYGKQAPQYIDLRAGGGFRLDTSTGSIALRDYSAAGAPLVRSMRMHKDGIYKVQLSGFGGDPSAAAGFITALAVRGIGSYLRFDGSWSVVSGYFLSEADAAAEAARLAALEVPGAQPIVIAPRATDLLVTDESGKPVFSADTAFPLAYAADGFNFFGSTNRNRWNYRGSLMIKRLPVSDMTAINRLPIEEYLYGVVPIEMSPAWPAEALKAQAVAARNYARASKTASKFTRYGFDLDDSTASQVYRGMNVEDARTNAAIDATRGQYLYSEGSVATLYYHSNSGGYTAASESIWSSYIPYLRATPDPYSIGAPQSSWTCVIDADSLESALNLAGKPVGQPHTLAIVRRTQDGRVHEMRIDGSAGSATLLRNQFRYVIGTGSVKSMLFSFSPALHGLSAAPPAQLALRRHAVLPASIVMLLPVTGRTAPDGTILPEVRPVRGYVSQNPPSLIRRADGELVDLVAGTLSPPVRPPAPTVPSAPPTIPAPTEPTAPPTVPAPTAPPSPTDVTVPITQPSDAGTALPPTESISIAGGRVTIYGRGYGHGVGMSQYGAKRMAEQGFSYVQILYFYYANTILR